MTRLELTQEKKIAVLDRAVLVGIPASFTWIALGRVADLLDVATLGGAVNASPETLLLVRLTAIAVGVGLGAPLALATVKLADGWGLDEDSREGGDRSGDGSTSR